MANSKMVQMFISHDNKVESQNEKMVDAYNALDHIKDMVAKELKFSFGSFCEATLPEIDSLIGALKELKKIKDESGSRSIDEAVKLVSMKR